MKSFAYFFALLLILLVSSTSQGAELVLRERATQHRPIIRLGDVAVISAASAAEMKILSSTPLLPAPAPGTQQFLSVAQVRDLLVARGIQMDRITIQGARLVEIGAATQQANTAEKPATPQLTQKEIEHRVQQAIERLLPNRTDAGRWRVEVSLNAGQISKVAELGSEFKARGQQKIRSGRQRFYLQGGSDQKDVFVTATITRIQPVVVVRQRIEREQYVRAADVEIVEREGNLPSGVLTELEQVVGKVAQRSLRPEDVVQENHLRAAWQVRRGEAVSVYVRTGGIVVRTRAVAKENGAMGELISVELLDGKKRLHASVSGPGEVAIHATGGRTTDYASLDRRDRQRR